VLELYMENFLLLQDLFNDLSHKNQLLWDSQKLQKGMPQSTHCLVSASYWFLTALNLSTLETEAVCSSETSVDTAVSYISEDSTPHRLPFLPTC
jgi:hypothetical protein